MHPAADSASQLPAPDSTLRRSRRRELLLLLAAMLATTVLFWATDLDLWLAELFFDPYNPAIPWPYEERQPWLFFYYAVPLFATLLTAGAALALALGLALRRFRPLRLPAAMVLLTLALGPGLLINTLFKENWGRPRPHQVEQFHGDLRYVPPLAIGHPGVGKSFCSGHASVGFSLVAFWFLFRHRPRLARGYFFAALFCGLLLGLGRMAGGGHFLSDILWSGYLTFLAAWFVYHFVLRIPQREARTQTAQRLPGTGVAALAGWSLAGMALIVGLLSFWPINARLGYPSADLTDAPPSALYLELDRADLLVRFGDGDTGPFSIRGRIRGNGLPNYRVESFGFPVQRDGPALLYRLSLKGFFTRLESRLTLDLDPSRIRRLVVHLRHGDIRVEPASGRPPPELELVTAEGRVLRTGPATAVLEGP